MGDLVFFVAWETPARSRITAIAFSGLQAAELLQAHPGATVRVKKAMPCAPRRYPEPVSSVPTVDGPMNFAIVTPCSQRRANDASIAAPFPVGQSPVPAGKE